MKKLFVAIMLLFILANFLSFNKFSLANYFDGTLTSYSELPSENCVDLGFCFASVGVENNSIGESVKIENCEVGSVIKELSADIVKTEYIEGLTIIYAYSKKVPTSIVVGNQNVNLQIAIKGEWCVVGWPLILGGF